MRFASRARIALLLGVALVLTVAGSAWAMRRGDAPPSLKGMTTPAGLTAVWPAGVNVNDIRPQYGATEPIHLQFNRSVGDPHQLLVQVFLNGAPLVTASEESDWQSAGAAVLYRVEGKEVLLRPAPPRKWFVGNLWVVLKLQGERAPATTVIGLSTGYPNPYWFLDSALPFVPLPVTKDSTATVALVRQSVTLESLTRQPTPVALEPGDSVQVLERTAERAKVRVYATPGLADLPSTYEAGPLQAGVLALAKKSIDGYLPTESLIDLPRPDLASSVLVGTVSESGEPAVMIFDLPGTSTVSAVDSAVSPTVFAAAAAQALMQWRSLPGQSYWSSYVDAQGNAVGWFDKAAHLPEGGWSDGEYQWYREARAAYLEGVRGLWSRAGLPPTLEGKRQELYDELVGRPAQLQDAWIDWGHRFQSYAPRDFAKLLEANAPTGGVCTTCELANAGTAEQFAAAWGRYIDQYTGGPALEALQRSLAQPAQP